MEVTNNTNTTFNNNELNIGQLNSMINEIESMTIEQHEQILKIINSNNDLNYTENENGFFIKLNTLTIDVILKIYEYVESIRHNQNDIKTAVQTFESYEHLNKSVFNTNNIEINHSNNEISSNIEIEDWKVAIIEKMRNSSKTKNKKKKINKDKE